jgi:hypothetical protein
MASSSSARVVSPSPEPVKKLFIDVVDAFVIVLVTANALLHDAERMQERRRARNLVFMVEMEMEMENETTEGLF